MYVDLCVDLPPFFYIHTVYGTLDILNVKHLEGSSIHVLKNYSNNSIDNYLCVFCVDYFLFIKILPQYFIVLTKASLTQNKRKWLFIIFHIIAYIFQLKLYLYITQQYSIM